MRLNKTGKEYFKKEYGNVKEVYVSSSNNLTYFVYRSKHDADAGAGSMFMTIKELQKLTYANCWL